MSEFIGELMKFADVGAESDLDPIEQFKILNHNVESTDRKVQLVALTKKYAALWQPIQNAFLPRLDPVRKHEGSVEASFTRLKPQAMAQIPKGEHLEAGHAHSFTVSRNNFAGGAMALLTGFAEGMDIHIYIASYTYPVAKDKAVEWSKVAVVEDSQQKISDRTLAVVVDALVNRIAHEIRNLNLQRDRI
jgi:hypothetical protein